MKNTATLPSAHRVFTTGRFSVICACALALACFLALRTSGYAQFGYAYTTNSGDWNNAAIWNTPPVNLLQAFVMGNDTVTFQSGDSYTGAYSFGFWGSLLIGASDGFIAGNGGTGTLNITGGTLTTGGWAVGGGAAAAGTINQSGGTFNAIGGQMLFGWGSTATMNISGGTMNMTGAGIWNIGHNTASSINVTDSGVANFTGGIGILNSSLINANGGGTVNISNATINVTAGSQLRATNGGSINLNGGNTFTGNGGFVLGGGSAVNVNSGTNTYAGQVSLADNATITAGSGALLTLNPGTGAAVSLTSGRTLTIAGAGSVQVGGAITGAGNLTLAGTGTVTLSASNNLSGNFIAGGGTGMTLRLGHNSALGAATVFWAQNLIVTSDGAAARTISNTVNLANIAYYGDATGTGDLIFTGTNIAGAPRILVVSNNTTISGVVSGVGGLDKRGAGTLTLSGSNSNTGETTLNGGTLILSNGSAITDTAAVILANTAGANLVVTNSETIGSLRGGGATGGNVGIAATRTLTVAEAGQQSFGGVMSGSGALTKSGAGTTTLTGGNTYSGATLVSNGELNLNRTGGEALTATTSVTVGSGATLLISQTGQVWDDATVTLSGGTIKRGGTVDEVFGNLNLTHASFLDYGSGGIGILRFGTYTPTSLLTVQNFAVGNKLQFGSTISAGDLSNPALFNFSSAFTTGTEGGFFTITAIPEPSTVAAALGLSALLGWPVIRRRFGKSKI